MPEPCKILRLSREVIEKKLLNSLENRPCVAIIATKADLDTILYALTKIHSERASDLKQGLSILRKQAFPGE